MNKQYLSKKFYESRKHSLNSAEIIVPIVLELTEVKSVIDLGCGTGEFLKVFSDNGVKDIFGIDGFWIKKEKLKIPENKFKKKDLTYKVEVNRKFDLSVSLEVGEHLPEKSAKNFVDTLTGFSNIVLFSSAIPLQGGYKHINEQWIDYWEKLFKDKNYVLIDCIRKRIWNNEKVSVWYRQNIFLFVEKNFISKNSRLKKEFEKTNQEMLSLVHPEIYLPKARIYWRLKNIVPLFIQNILAKIRPNI